jgi:hypothetical protein
MLSVARVFYAYDLLSLLVYLTGDGLKLALASYQDNRQRHNFLLTLCKKILQKNLNP